ncbi:unnamed protein product, partial [Effrenium voratum]
MAMTRLSDLRAFFRVAPEVWAAVVSTLGDPAEDLRPFAAVPPAALAMACETADIQGAAMTAIQASQADETEFMVEPEETRAKWVTQYVSLTGGLPPEEEEPSMEQLSALSRRVFSLKGAPYADFSVRVPYGKKALRTARFRSYVATLEGFVTKELAGGYKSAHMYLAEAKLVHIESGAQWTDLHARSMKQCLLAVTRGLGPRKKAPEVPVARILEARITKKGRAKTLLALPKEVFLFGMMWEVEVASLKQGDLLINEQEKRVILNLNESKKDQEGRGVKRVLQCTCAEACDWACPLANAKALSPAKGVVDLEAPLCLTVGGTCPTKSQVVASWSKFFGMKVSGHSARRTGALNYIRQGWTIAQVAYLGRWKSDVIYSYAEEALESIPVNQGQFGATQSPLQGSAAEEVRTNLVVEIEALKLDSVATKARLDKEVAAWQARLDEGQGNLPKLVKSVHSAVTLQRQLGSLHTTGH